MAAGMNNAIKPAPAAAAAEPLAKKAGNKYSTLATHISYQSQTQKEAEAEQEEPLRSLKGSKRVLIFVNDSVSANVIASRRKLSNSQARLARCAVA